VIAVAEELKKFRELLRIRELYDIAAAIRGPDLRFGDGLKWALTFPIRDIVIHGKDPIDTILHHMCPENLDDIFNDLEHIEGSLSHYLSHIHSAIITLSHLIEIPQSIVNYALNYIDVIWRAHVAVREDLQTELKKAMDGKKKLAQCWVMLRHKHYGEEV